MCYKGKCLHCLKVETGTLIYAILNLPFSVLGAMISGFELISTNIANQEVMRKAVEEKNEKLYQLALILGYGANIIIPILIVCFCMSFSFTIYLIVGLCKRKANYVKAFYIYGIVQLVFALAATVVWVIVLGDRQTGAIMLIGGVFFIMILAMIRKTYQKFENEVTYDKFSNQIAVISKY